jgi:hypothetical protein
MLLPLFQLLCLTTCMDPKATKTLALFKVRMINKFWILYSFFSSFDSLMSFCCFIMSQGSSSRLAQLPASSIFLSLSTTF